MWRLFPLVLRDSLAPELFIRSDISPETRPFQLSLHEFSRLVEAYWDLCQREPKLFDYNHRAPLSERGEDEWGEDREIVSA
ncbi:hypothetical protein B566_EDAN018983 [Ephemera danica]|nr:hypothetical protein B566_EDAN018983 [Ephemera danica]